MNKLSVLQNVSIAVSAVLLLLALLSGLHTGRQRAAGLVVLQNLDQIGKGLSAFQADQDRYPSAFEFSDRNVMSSYFNVFPPAIVPAGCQQDFVYQNPTPASFVLQFCLPVAVGGFRAGWSQVQSVPSTQ